MRQESNCSRFSAGIAIRHFQTSLQRLCVRFLLLAGIGLCCAVSGCALFVPAPTLQIARNPPGPSLASGVVAPPQKAWQIDDNRWFEGEVDSVCWGRFRFVDKQHGIDSFVGIFDPDPVNFSSDDPDIVLAGLANLDKNLLYSTNGGRTFLMDQRGFPRYTPIKFIAARQGKIYAGLWDIDIRGVDKGYYDWEYTTLYNGKPNGKTAISHLVVLEASINKKSGQIGPYALVVPKGHPYLKLVPDFASPDVRIVDSLDPLQLPRQEGFKPSQSCDTMHLPPWAHSGWSRQDVDHFLTWYEDTQKANPGWNTPEIEQFIDRNVRHIYP